MPNNLWLVLPSDPAFLGVSETIGQALKIEKPVIVETPVGLIPSCIWAACAKKISGDRHRGYYRTDLAQINLRKVLTGTPDLIWGKTDAK